MFWKKVALGDFALIDSFLEHLISFYQQHFSFMCILVLFFSFCESSSQYPSLQAALAVAHDCVL